MPELVAPAAHAEFQYHDARHQSQTALSGMWLFLATEVLFFGGLVFAWLIYHRMHPAGFGTPGPYQGSAQIFYVIYYIATVLHAVHMAIGVGLVSWIGWSARRGAYSREWHTPVQVVGLYWSFVDIVWLTFYPLIYVIGRT